MRAAISPRTGRRTRAECPAAALGRHQVGAVLAGRREHGQRRRLDHGHQLRAGGMGGVGQLAHRLQAAEEVGLLRHQAGHGGVQHLLRRRDRVRRCRPRPGRPAPRRSRCPASSSRWPARRAPAGDGGRDRDPVAAGQAAGHQGRLGGGGGAVVAGAGHLHPGQLADQRLELVDALQRALAHLRLAGVYEVANSLRPITSITTDGTRCR